VSYLALIVTLVLAFWPDFLGAELGDKGFKAITNAFITLVIVNAIFILKQLAVTSPFWSLDTKLSEETPERAHQRKNPLENRA
jgi:hypothetical protein